MREHGPVVKWLRLKSSTRAWKDELDNSKMDKAREIASMICGENGCNYSCRLPCEALKFLVISYLAKENPDSYRETIYEDSIGRYG